MLMAPLPLTCNNMKNIHWKQSLQNYTTLWKNLYKETLHPKKLSWNCQQNVAKILQHLRFVADFSEKMCRDTTIRILLSTYVGHTRGRKSFFICYWILGFFGRRGAHCTKKEKKYIWKYFFCPKVCFFSGYFWNGDKMLFVICCVIQFQIVAKNVKFN